VVTLLLPRCFLHVASSTLFPARCMLHVVCCTLYVAPRSVFDAASILFHSARAECRRGSRRFDARGRVRGLFGPSAHLAGRSVGAHLQQPRLATFAAHTETETPSLSVAVRRGRPPTAAPKSAETIRIGNFRRKAAPCAGAGRSRLPRRAGYHRVAGVQYVNSVGASCWDWLGRWPIWTVAHKRKMFRRGIRHR
jgi:hypothetical protein